MPGAMIFDRVGTLFQTNKILRMVKLSYRTPSSLILRLHNCEIRL
ncbi:hypothetical protein SAMN03159341_1527 [Paenibacillus sp. 1_12]|nr:hypothetical protein SAMN03159341_1527 [Paenibacillus sp. 1_12]